MLRVHPITIRRWSRTGKIPFIVISARGDRRYRLADVTLLMEQGLRSQEAIMAEYEANQLENDDVRMKASFKEEKV